MGQPTERVVQQADADLDRLPEVARGPAAACLEPGERVAWLGQPVMTLRVTSRRQAKWVLGVVLVLPALAVYFGIVHNAAGDAWEAARTAVFLWALIVPIPLLAVAVGFLWPRALRWGAGRTAYLLTDRRAVVVDGGFAPDWWPFAYLLERFAGRQAPAPVARTWNLKHLNIWFPELEQRAGGVGDVWLSGRDYTEWDSDKERDRRIRERDGFKSIPDAEAVYERVRTALTGRPG